MWSPSSRTPSHAASSSTGTAAEAVAAGGADRGGGQWALVVAHFLGVDHVGHTHGAWNEVMTRKLLQLDGVVQRTVAALDDDTLLVVMGDHGNDSQRLRELARRCPVVFVFFRCCLKELARAPCRGAGMTSSGNHGGATADEVTSALLVVSKRGVIHSAAGDSFPPVFDSTVATPVFDSTPAAVVQQVCRDARVAASVVAVLAFCICHFHRRFSRTCTSHTLFAATGSGGHRISELLHPIAL